MYKYIYMYIDTQYSCHKNDDNVSDTCTNNHHHENDTDIKNNTHHDHESYHTYLCVCVNIYM